MTEACAARLADLVLVVHAAFVVFVVIGLASIWIGHAMDRWPWVDRPAFRLAHAAAIALVVAESWLGLECPLTTLERSLRRVAGEPAWPAADGFVASWLSGLLYFDAPSRAFTLVYSLFGLCVLYTLWRFPMRR